MLTDFWRIDLGTSLAIVVPLVLTVAGGVYRICQRIFALEQRMTGLLEQQEERASAQDRRHAENRSDIQEIRDVLMGRRER